jgi:hypothetical protein
MESCGTYSVQSSSKNSRSGVPAGFDACPGKVILLEGERCTQVSAIHPSHISDPAQTENVT